MSDHVFEPELNSPIPRRVGYRDGVATGCGIWFIRLFILPHTIGGIGFLCLAIGSTGLFLAVGLFGTTYEGRIVKKDDTRAVKGTKHWYVQYTYDVDGQAYWSEVQVSN